MTRKFTQEEANKINALVADRERLVEVYNGLNNGTIVPSYKSVSDAVASVRDDIYFIDVKYAELTK